MNDIKKEIEVFYGDFKNVLDMLSVKDSYNKENKTIRCIVKEYLVEYKEINRRRDAEKKCVELAKLPGLCQIETKDFDLIRLCRFEVKDSFFLYSPEERKKEKVNIEGRKHFLCVPVELIDRFLEVEGKKVKNVYILANDVDNTLIKL